MAAPTFVNSAVGAVAASTTATTIAQPASIVAGNLLVCLCTMNNTSTAGATTATNGWQQVVYLTAGSGTVVATMCAFAKLANGVDDTGTISKGGDSGDGISVTYQISGAETDPTLVLAATSATTINPPNLSMGATRDHLFIAAINADLWSAAATAAPSGYSSFTTVSSGTISLVGKTTMYTAHRALTAVSAEDPGTFPSAAGSSTLIAMTLGIRPYVSTSRPPVTRRPLVGALLDF